MNPAWSEFLSQRGARIDNGAVVDFKNDNTTNYQLDEIGILCDLSFESWLCAAGQDAESFLQGQLTNDIASLDARHSQLQGFCSPKGRLICVLRVVRHRQGFLLQLPAELSTGVLNRLKRYVLRAKVNLEIADHLIGIGIAGPDSVDLLSQGIGPVPDAPGGYREIGELGIYRLASRIPRFQVVGPVSDICPLWETLSGPLNPVGPVPWALLDIQAGIPQIYPETSELFVPQMINLDLIDGVSFKKGCYPGQEIVARMHYLGKLKQRMIRAQVEIDTVPRPGDRIFSPDHGEQSAGTVLNAQPLGSNQYDLLVVVQLSGYRNGKLFFKNLNGPALSALPLPYDIPVD